MNQVISCPKCGKEMREGELFIKVSSSGGDQYMSSGLERGPAGATFSMPPMVNGEGPFWRERTGEKKGWVIKREETQTFKIRGLRCTACGFIEFYASK
jgi:predicted nucleic-acid-binding Zn-ribbon protein